MIVEVKVPQLAESIPDATLLEWKKQPGDAVAQDEILIELETDKVVLEVPAPAAGVVAELLKNDGDVVVSQEVLARIDTEGAAAAPAPAAKQAPAPVAAAPAPAAPAAVAGDLSPAVRKLVDEHGLDPAAITGTGKGGRLTKGDVLEHIEKQPSAPAPASAPPAPAPPPAPPVCAASAGRARRSPRADEPLALAHRGTPQGRAEHRRHPHHVQRGQHGAGHGDALALQGAVRKGARRASWLHVVLRQGCRAGSATFPGRQRLH